MKTRLAFILLSVLALTSLATAADAPAKVSFTANDEKVSSVIEKICKDTDLRIGLEKSADVKITATATDLPVEEALTMIAKAGDLAWRRVYIRADSPLIKNPETMAATVRLMEGLQFPNLLLEGSPTTQSLVHVANKPAVDAIPVSMRKDMGMVAIYLITNDKAAKEAKAKSDTTLAKYMELQKEAMKLFMEMTPEEREQAMASGMQMVQTMDPNYMAEMTKSVLKMDPQTLGQLTQTQMQSFFAMPPADRKALLRMQMQATQFITPEQMKIIQEEAMEVMKEMGMDVPHPPAQ